MTRHAIPQRHSRSFADTVTWFRPHKANAFISYRSSLDFELFFFLTMLGISIWKVRLLLARYSIEGVLSNYW